MAEAYIELPNGQFERAQSVSLGGRLVLMETVVLSKSDGTLVDYASEATLQSIETFSGSISTAQTDGSQRTAIQVFGEDLTANNPLPTDGDSLYEKDINAANSSLGTFTGTITDLFDTSMPGYLVDSSATNPKHFTVQLTRPITSDDIGIETTDGNFSNVKIELMDALDNVLLTLNDSANNTKYTAHCYDFVPIKFCRLKISFHTADAVKIKFLSIDKIQQASARIQAIDEDTGIIGNVQMSGGDFNVLSRLRNATGNTKINPATSDAQTNGTQKTQVVGGGNTLSPNTDGSINGKIRDRVASRNAEVSFTNAIRTHEVTRLIGISITGTTLDTNFWSTSSAGSGVLTQANGQQTLTTGSTANSTIQLQSNRKARFLFACPNIYRGAIRLGDNGTANNIRRWGVFDADNGMFFQLSGTTFSVVCRRAASDATKVDSGSFNGGVSSYSPDTNVHAYEIHYYVMKAEFYIDGVLIHTFTPTTATLCGSLTLPITMQNNNSGGSTTNITIESFNQSVLRTGYEHHNPYYKRITTLATTVCKYGAGSIHRVIVGAKGSGSTATIYDNTSASGQIIAVLDTSTNNQTYEMNCDFFNGLTIVTASGVAPDITVVFE